MNDQKVNKGGDSNKTKGRRASKYLPLREKGNNIYGTK